MDELRISPYPPQPFWKTVLADLALQMTRCTFVTWLEQTRAIELEEDVLTVQVESERAKEWIENRLNLKVQGSVEMICDRPLEIRYVVDPSPPALRPSSLTSRQVRSSTHQRQSRARVYPPRNGR
jgi:chromosomal replication initiation ATPase DnaA